MDIDSPRSLTSFILQFEQSRYGQNHELSSLLSCISLGTKMINNLVASAGVAQRLVVEDIEETSSNPFRAIEIQADNILVQLLRESGHFGLLISELRDSVAANAVGRSDAQYIVAFDPLDGVSNLGSCVPVGTIFTILRKKETHRPAILDDFLQAGNAIVAAGYAIYGAKTCLVLSLGAGVHGFTLDPSIGEFILTEQSISIPEQGKWYSANEGYSSQWNTSTIDYIAALKSSEFSDQPYMSRYVGSLVVDFDRNLREGGILLHPANDTRPRGKLRLLYECMPLAYIAEQAGGAATDGIQPILEITPSDIRERCPLFIGGKNELRWIEEFSAH